MFSILHESFLHPKCNLRKRHVTLACNSCLWLVQSISCQQKFADELGSCLHSKCWVLLLTTVMGKWNEFNSYFTCFVCRGCIFMCCAQSANSSMHTTVAHSSTRMIHVRFGTWMITCIKKRVTPYSEFVAERKHTDEMILHPMIACGNAKAGCWWTMSG